jgi:hypothetical protein
MTKKPKPVFLEGESDPLSLPEAFAFIEKYSLSSNAMSMAYSLLFNAILRASPKKSMAYEAVGKMIKDFIILSSFFMMES